MDGGGRDYGENNYNNYNLENRGEASVILDTRAAKNLIALGDGDAALLYLTLLYHQSQDTSPTPRTLADELRWDSDRLRAAEDRLKTQGIEILKQPETPRIYTRADIISSLENSGDFRKLLKEVEHRLGRRLSTPDLSILLGLYHDLNLPSDVIYLLVCYCTDQAASKYGAGRLPTLRQIEQEGYSWARLGIHTQAAAANYLNGSGDKNNKNNYKNNNYLEYMRVLGMGDRLPVSSEEKYLEAWREWGFPAESVALAYDKTVLNCHEFKWAYCNGILKRWHQDGFHTAEEIETEDYKFHQDKNYNNINNQEFTRKSHISSEYSFENMVRKFHEKLNERQA